VAAWTETTFDRIELLFFLFEVVDIGDNRAEEENEKKK